MNTHSSPVSNYNPMSKQSPRSCVFWMSSLTALIVVAITFTVVLIIKFGKTLEEPETSSESLMTLPPRPSTSLAETTEPELVQQTTSINQRVTIEELIVECPEPFVWGNNGFGLLSEQCVSMLEPFFIDLPYIPEYGFQWLDFPERITHRRIFQNPQQDRELVFDALSRAECRFEDGEKIRPDLRTTCHAESFHAYSSFLEACLWYQDSRSNRRDYDLYSSRVDTSPTAELWEEHLTELATSEDGSLNKAQYSRLQQDVWHTELATHWYRRKCTEYDLNAIKLDRSQRDLEYFNTVSSIGERLGISPKLRDNKYIHDSDMYFVINVLAAHFGEYSASVLYSRKRVGQEIWDSRGVDYSLVSANRERHPWMKFFFKAADLSNFGKFVGDLPNHGILWGDTEYNRDFVKFVDRSIEGLLILDEAQVEFDLAALVDQLCRRLTDYENKQNDRNLTCRDAIEKLNTGPDVSFKKGLKLEAFKEIAIELGIWN